MQLTLLALLATWSSSDVQAIAESLQALAAVIGLPYIALQVRNAKTDAKQQSDHAAHLTLLHTEQLAHQVKAIEGHTSAAEATVYQGLIDLMMKIELCFVERPELRPLFYGGQDLPPATPEYQRALAIAEMFRDLEDHIARHDRFLDANVFAGWRRYFAFIRQRSPIFCRFCVETSDWYRDGAFGTTVPP